MAGSRRLTAMRAYDHHIRHIDGRFALENPPLYATPRVRLHVALNHIHSFHEHLMLSRPHLDHPAGLSFVLTGYDHHSIIFSKVQLYVHGFSDPAFLITAGARLTILVKRFSRNSRATGPNTRVPTGSLSGLIRTAAF